MAPICRPDPVPLTVLHCTVEAFVLVAIDGVFSGASIIRKAMPADR